jgi:microcystin-dependent protein
MATVTKGRTFVSGEVVTPTKLNTLVDSATVTGIVNADIDAAAAIVDTKLATIATAGKVANTATTATSANTANAIVARDASGNFSAGTITATAFAGTGATLLVPTGAVMPFAMNSAPSGWLAADGSAVSRTTYSALWMALGTTSSPYGQGDGSTTFNLPDLRGYFVRGVGTNSDGTAAGTFGAKQADALKDHTHNYTRLSITDSGNASPDGSGKNWPTITSTSLGVNAPNNNGAETRPRNIAMLYCIKF